MQKILFLSAVLSLSSNGMTFKEAAKKLESHDAILEISAKSKVLESSASMEGSWGDPKLKLAAKNLPKDNLKFDQTGMSGFEIGLSSKVALSNKYGNKEDSMRSLSKSMSYSAEDRKRVMTKYLWQYSIEKRRLMEEKVILKENLAWISKMVTVSKRLYANGKESQQALLEIQIRKSEIESKLSNNKYALRSLEKQLGYLIPNSSVSLSSTPWDILESNSGDNLKDYQELSIKENLKAADLRVKASKKNFIPDLNVSIGYTKREFDDGNGDFVSASVSMPLPFSSEKYANHSKAINERLAAQKKLNNYHQQKKRDLGSLEDDILALDEELSIIKSKTVKFAKNARVVTSKAYGLGSSTYLELLKSEFTLQQILLKKISLERIRLNKLLELKYRKGEPLI